MIYRRVIELRRGGSFLDAGTCHGFLPLLLATAQPAGDRSGPAVVGLDIEDLLLQAAARFAEQEGISGVEFVTADLLGPRTESLPRFDTVTAIHLFEHLDSDAVDHPIKEHGWSWTVDGSGVAGQRQ
ncbi:class I SAM-dependent methyltransferase [Nonomuraea mesophila]|uniref:class I SAM-dependent methyltransferase n=1 Tax=Nonomuraea mesophila TaxID=2530382 RepID=UPI00140E9296|nr:class I SAM-dependent methyltransferase [Nonomuraea mesophila]